MSIGETSSKLINTRILSLDVFRGLTIMFMIIVNNAGNSQFVYWPLEHSQWNGITPTDLVFPFFLFISGVSIVFALSSRKESGLKFPELISKIIRRGITLVLIGIAIHSIPGFWYLTHWSWEHFFGQMRFPGVLQRIGLVYIAASLLFLYCEQRTIWIISFALILVYYLLLAFIPVPGVGPATFAPAMNLESWVDRFVLSTNHTYHTTMFWDPEGILSTLPSISSGLFGILTGYALKKKSDAMQKLKFMLIQGVLLIVVGLLFSLIFPINKNLWSSSFVLITSGLANLFLALCFYIIDVRGNSSWTKPFIVYGMNSILVYAIAESLEPLMNYIQLPGPQGRPIGLFGFIYIHIFEPLFASHYNSSMAWSVCYMLLFMPLLWYFYKKKIFLKV